MKHPRTIAVIAVALASLVASATVVLAQAPRTGQALKLALPEPGKKAPSGVTEYVGTKGAKKASLALVVHRNGAAVGFLCDGTRTWKWFTGRVTNGEVALTGAGGARLTGTVTPSRARLRVAGVPRGNGAYVLPKAIRGVGLFRIVRNLEDKPVEVGWISTNGAKLVGAASKDGELVGTTHTSSQDPNAVGEVNPNAGGPPVPATFLGGLRCGVIVIKITRAQSDILAGNGSANGTKNDLIGRFKDLDCGGEGFAFPQ